MTSYAKHSLPRLGHLEWCDSASIVGWFVLLAASWSYLTLHDLATASDAPQPMVTCWPSGSGIERSPGRPALLLFLHPKCPCSRATVRELDRMFANVSCKSTDLFVVAAVPADASDEWINTVTVTTARWLPNAALFVDRSGVEAARFGATVSGQLMLFDTTGFRQFAGGVTASRGHEGASPGADALSAVLRNQGRRQRDFPVYGCQLCLPDEAAPPQPVAVTSAIQQEPGRLTLTGASVGLVGPRGSNPDR